MKAPLLCLLSVLAAGLATSQPATFTTTRDVEYASTGGISLKLDLYVPDGPGPYPAVVFIHGGGWSGGDKSLNVNSSRVRQASRGYVVASINYRLSGQATFPAQSYDCKAALRWLRANASRYRIDPARIGLWGSSAGGHLVALLGTSGDVADLEGSLGNASFSSRVQCVVDWYGPSDLTTIDAQAPACSSIPSGPTAPHALLLGCPPSACPDTARRASPVAYVTADDPPFYIAHGTNDCTVPPAQSQELYDALVAKGVPATLRMLQGSGHGGPAFDDATNLPELEAFLDRHLKASTAGTTSWLVPSSARAAGQNGAFYTTDLTVANTGTATATFTLKFLGNGVDGRSGAEQTFALGAGKSATYADVLGGVFGLTSAFGAIQVKADTAALAVSSQTWTPGGGGTFGQSVPAAGASDLIASGGTRSISAVREDTSFRTNLVLANAGETSVDVDVTLVGDDGATLKAKRYTLPPLGMTQVSRVVADLGVTANVTGARLVLSTPTSGGSFAAYGSVIDNVTNDPRTLLPR